MNKYLYSRPTTALLVLTSPVWVAALSLREIGIVALRDGPLLAREIAKAGHWSMIEPVQAAITRIRTRLSATGKAVAKRTVAAGEETKDRFVEAVYYLRDTRASLRWIGSSIGDIGDAIREIALCIRAAAAVILTGRGY